MIKLKLKNEISKLSFNISDTKKFKVKVGKKCIVSSIYSKYVIVGGGFTGINLTKKLLSAPYKIPSEDITLIDSIPEFTNYNKLKYYLNIEIKLHHLNNYSIEDILPNNTKFRNYEAFKIDPNEKILYGENSLRLNYDKLFLCAGLQPEYSQVDGLLYALDDSQNNVFSSYHFDKAVSKMAIFIHCLKYKVINLQKLTQRDLNFIEHGYGNIVYSCLDNRRKSIKKDDSIRQRCNFDKLYDLQITDEFFYNFVECAHNLILLYDILYRSRNRLEREKFMNSNNFYLTIPFTKEYFFENLSITSEELKDFNIDLLDDYRKYDNIINILDKNKIVLAQFLFDELDKRGVKILWGHQLKKVNLNNNLVFSNDKEIEYNISFVVPNLTFPSILKYGLINSVKLDGSQEDKLNIKDKVNSSKFKNLDYFEFDDNLFVDEYVDYGRMQLKSFKDIYVLGDSLKAFYDRQYQNVFLQSHILANNIKVMRNNLDKKYIEEYKNNKSIFLDYDMKHYLFVNDGKLELLKKNFWNKYYIEALYHNHDNKFMLKHLFKKKLGLILNKIR